MSTLNLTGSINVDKVRPGSDTAMASVRIQDPAFMSCPVWNKQDNFGRETSINAFDATTAGCQSPAAVMDRESAVRPQYMNYTTLNAAGIQGDMGLAQSMAKQSIQRRQQLLTTGSSSVGPYAHTGFGSVAHIRSEAPVIYKDITQPAARLQRMRQSEKSVVVNGRKYAMSGSHY